jgi:hypothetical protein
MLLQEGLLVADEAYMSCASFGLEHISVLTINILRNRSRGCRGANRSIIHLNKPLVVEVLSRAANKLEHLHT